VQTLLSHITVLLCKKDYRGNKGFFPGPHDMRDYIREGKKKKRRIFHKRFSLDL
jgi:hypothetical protein